MNRTLIILGMMLCCCSPGRTQVAPGLQRLYEYLRAEGEEPSSYILSKFAGHDVVLLGEDHGVRENLVFVAGLIPRLYTAGVRNIGMEFGASDDQAPLDSLVTAARYDVQAARNIMFDYNVGWAYKEYTDIYRAAWRFNRHQSRGAKKFRIFNISYIYDWTAFDGQRSRGTMEKVFFKGPIDTYRADIIDREIIQKGEKILILTGTPHASIKPDIPSSADNPYLNADLGRRLYSKYPDRVFSIMFHQPFDLRESDSARCAFAGDSIIEDVVRALENRPIGFDVDTTDVGVVTDSGSFAGGLSRSMPGQFQGYIFLKPLARLTGCTIDTGFYTRKSWENILRNFPDPDWHKRPESLAELWIQIRDFVDLKKRYRQGSGK